MAHATFKKKLLPCLITIALAGTYSTVNAAEGDDSDNKDAETVEIHGIRDSLKKNLADKRDADSIIEVVNAEDIGKFPDKNVAESLQRITGVGIERAFGEGEKVSVRGTAPNLNRTIVDGHSIATADWFILDQLNASRSFNYLMLPPELVGNLQVVKSPQADTEEGSLGATVNVNTRRALDMNEPITAAGSLQFTQNKKADENNPQFSGLFAWHNDEKNFGVLVSATHSETDIRRDGIEVLGYSDRVLTPSNGPTGTYAVPDLIGSAYFTQTRERDALTLGLQFAPNDNLLLGLNVLNANMEADNVNSNYLAWFTNKFGAGESPSNAMVDSHGTVVSGQFAVDPDSWGAVYDTFVREGSTDTNSISADAKWTSGDWTISGQVGSTKGTGETGRQLIWETVSRSGFTWDLSAAAPQVNFTEIDVNDPVQAGTENGWNGERDVHNEDSEDFIYADAELALDVGVFNALKFGIKSTEHERDVAFNGTVYHGLYSATACDGGPCGVAAVAGNTLPSDFMSGYDVLDSYRLVSPEALYRVYNALPSNGMCTPTSGTVCDTPVASASYNIVEKNKAIYAMAKFSDGDWRGNVGLRFVKTEVSATGHQTGVDAATPGAKYSVFDGFYINNTETDSYNDVLPSLNVSYSLAENQVLRFAAAKVMARADYSSMAPNISLNTTSYTGGGGNPGLEPYRAKQLDVSYEYYLDDTSAINVAIFNKKIDSYISSDVFAETHAVFFDPDGTVDPGSNCTDAGNNVWNCEFDVSRPTNGDGGKTNGIELSFQKTYDNGFGFFANYTKLKAEDADGDALPGSAEKTYNLSGFFEGEQFSARLSLNSRDDFYIGVDHGREQWMEASKFVDLSLSYKFNDHLQLVATGSNLTDQEIVQYYDGLKNRPNAVYQTGPSYSAGVRLNF